MTNKNTDYEILAQEVYQQILKEDGIDTIKVQHNVKIKGDSGQKHQIDVYWEFNMAKVKHRVAIECKNFTTPVSIGKIRDFSSVLDDIGNIQGIFITKTHFQSGAIKFAEHKGIQLKLLTNPTTEDLKSMGMIDTINISGDIYYIANTYPDIKFDFDWLLQNTNMKEGDPFKVAAYNCDILIVNSKGNTIKTFLDLENDLPRPTNTKEDQTGLIYKYEFNDKYLTWPNCPYPRLKVKYIEFKYDVFCTSMITKFEGNLAADALLKDIKSGEIHLHGNRTKWGKAGF